MKAFNLKCLQNLILAKVGLKCLNWRHLDFFLFTSHLPLKGPFSSNWLVGSLRLTGLVLNIYTIFKNQDNKSSLVTYKAKAKVMTTHSLPGLSVRFSWYPLKKFWHNIRLSCHTNADIKMWGYTLPSQKANEGSTETAWNNRGFTMICMWNLHWQVWRMSGHR